MVRGLTAVKEKGELLTLSLRLVAYHCTLENGSGSPAAPRIV